MMRIDLLNYGKTGKTFYEDFITFVKRRKVVIFAVIIATLLGFGYDIWNFSLSPDEERELVRAVGTNIDIRNLLLRESRYGGWIIRQILTVDGIFTPCIDTFVAVISFGFSSIIWCMCIDLTAGNGRVRTASMVVFAILYITFPYVIADLFSYGICNSLSGMLLLLGTIVQYDLFKSFLNGGHDWGMIRGIILATFLFISAETCITLFAMSSAMIAFFYIFYTNQNDRRSVFSFIGRVMTVFFISLAFSFLIKLLDSSNNNYQNQFIYWNGSTPIIEQIKSMVHACTTYFTQSNLLGQRCLLCGLILSLLAIVVYLIQKHNAKALLVAAIYVCVIVLAFSIVIICGGVMPVRTMVTLQLLSGFLWFLTVEVFQNKKVIYTLMLAISFYIGFRQVVYLNRAFTGSNLCAQLDMEMGYKIGTDIQREAGSKTPNQPVVFIGRYQHAAENIYRIDASGQSIFYRNDTIYKNFFMSYLGFNFQHANSNIIEEAEKRAVKQTAYPLDGYIQVYDDMIIIKLSGAQYYIGEEVAEESRLSLEDMPITAAQSAAKCGVGWIGYNGIYYSCNGEKPDENNQIRISSDKDVSISGWACDFENKEPLSALYVCIGDHVVSCNYGVDRKDVAEYYSSDRLRYVGFSVLIPHELLEDDGNTELKFLMVSSDAGSVYEPVLYQLVY